jgi:hypothetical protein
MREMAPHLVSVQMSLSSLHQELTRQIEPGAPAPSKRLKALQKLAEHGFWTTVRINPLFPIYPDGYYTNAHFDHAQPVQPFNFFSWDMIEVIAQHKVPSVVVGVVRLYGPNLHFMRQALGYDIRAHFAKGVKEERKALHFSAAETAYYYSTIQKLCQQYGLRFSTCYIGNDARGESFYRYQHLWSNRADCCDAVGNVPAFQTASAAVLCVASHGTEPHASTSTPATPSQTAGRKPRPMQSEAVILPGINIQAPWAQAIVSGRKVIETRFYPLPEKWVGQPLVILETPGKARHFKRRVAGFVVFEKSWCYADKASFAQDRAKHLVDPDDPLFGWKHDDKPKWAWPIRWVEAYQQPLPTDFRAGIRYARTVEILCPPATLVARLSEI